MIYNNNKYIIPFKYHTDISKALPADAIYRNRNMGLTFFEANNNINEFYAPYNLLCSYALSIVPSTDKGNKSIGSVTCTNVTDDPWGNPPQSWYTTSTDVMTTSEDGLAIYNMYGNEWSWGLPLIQPTKNTGASCISQSTVKSYDDLKSDEFGISFHKLNLKARSSCPMQEYAQIIFKIDNVESFFNNTVYAYISGEIVFENSLGGRAVDRIFIPVALSTSLPSTGVVDFNHAYGKGFFDSKNQAMSDNNDLLVESMNEEVRKIDSSFDAKNTKSMTVNSLTTATYRCAGRVVFPSYIEDEDYGYSEFYLTVGIPAFTLSNYNESKAWNGTFGIVSSKINIDFVKYSGR